MKAYLRQWRLYNLYKCVFIWWQIFTLEKICNFSLDSDPRPELNPIRICICLKAWIWIQIRIHTQWMRIWNTGLKVIASVFIKYRKLHLQFVKLFDLSKFTGILVLSWKNFTQIKAIKIEQKSFHFPSVFCFWKIVLILWKTYFSQKLKTLVELVKKFKN
jgi:hypothetical protein